MRYLLAIAAILAAGPALAQEIPEGQSCGGLFCDLGIFGHKTAPAAAPATPPAKAVPTLAPAPDAAAIAAEPRKRIVRKKRVAPVTVATRPVAAPAASTPVAAVPVAATPVAALPVAAAPEAVRVAPAAAPLAKLAPTATAAAPPKGDEPIIFMDPAGQPPPLANMFRPIYR